MVCSTGVQSAKICGPTCFPPEKADGFKVKSVHLDP